MLYMGLGNIPAWFLQIGAPFFSAPISDMMNLSLSSSTVPGECSLNSAITQNTFPTLALRLQTHLHYPSSLQIAGTRCSHRLYIYPSLQSPPSNLSFLRQFAFQPTVSTTVARFNLLHTITTLLQTNHYVIVHALDFSKAFDSVQHSAVLDKCLPLKMPDNIHNCIESFFRDHSHCTRFGNECSEFRKIMASIIQGSVISPAS